MKKKILIRIGSLRHGGAEKVLVTFLKNLPEDKYEIDLLLNLYSGKYLKEVPSWINVYYLNKGEMITTNRLQDIPQKAFRVIYQAVLKMFPILLYKFILPAKKYDIEFAAIHTIADEILNSPNRNSKKIVWIHNDLSTVPGYSGDKVKKLFEFDKIMVISEKIQNYIEQFASNELDKQKIVRIYNPIDTQEILEKSKNPLLNYRFDEHIPTFISVGTVFPQKGFDRLLKAHERLLNEGIKHKILIIGNGPDLDKIKKLSHTLGLEETFTMLGFCDNPYPYFKNADFYVLSSRYEGFPTVLFEAITLGKIIVTTNVSGVSEMLNDGELGLIVENSEEGIYNGMKDVLTNPELGKKFKSKIANFTQPFSLENSVREIEGILNEL